YSDAIAALCVCLGLWLHLRGRVYAAAIVWVLAIATRQYMVAFPLAVSGWEFFGRRKAAARPTVRWLLPLTAAASLAGWMIFFGGEVPPSGAARIWPADRGRFFVD